MYLDIAQKVNIIKCTKAKHDLTFKEVIFQENVDSSDALKFLKTIQQSYLENVCYELLHGLKDHMSISFRDKYTKEEIRFYVSD